VRTERRWLLLSMIATLSVGGRIEAQAPASVTAPGLRIEWTADRARGRWQSLCGYIYNDTADAPREVRLLVEGRDHAERLVDSRIVPVLGYIAPRGRTYFCSTALAGAARYSVTIVGAEMQSDR
jgi:hypothetical protein